jgi:hypothetical protein
MEGLEILLFHPLDRHETHRRPSNGLTDGLGIAGIVLGRLDIRFDELWSDQPHLMTMFAETSGPIVGTPTGFHAYA